MSLSTTEFSKHLSYLLRHGAHKEKLPITVDGFCKLSDILALRSSRKFAHITADKVEQLVAQNTKQRFFCFRDADDGALWIRANQGHSLKNVAVDLEPITSAAAQPVVLHGTYMSVWPSIAEQGLSRRQRQHIHFCAGEDAVSGMRANCTVLIYVDLQKALNDGFLFYRSANGVILCAGNDRGFLPPKYFSKVVKRKTGERLQFKP